MLVNIVKTARTLLPLSGSVTRKQIVEAIDNVLLMPIYHGFDKGLLIRELESLYNIRMDDFRIIEKNESRRPWINNNISSIKWNFWNRYRDFLQVEKNYPETVLIQLDKLTNRILDGLFNPNINGIIDKRGLVVGQVQSGKTSNYTGLICKASDAGFKLIIVLTGIHNNLRSQTQLRLDEGFLGFDTQFQRAFNTGEHTIGVGIGRGALPVHSATSSSDNGDFNSKTTLTFNTNEPIIAIVKKNSSVLQKLFQWLSAQATLDSDGKRKINNKSLLLIDDEADNASINTNKDEDKSTKINDHIRNILRLFDKSGYVGYTATPFANIFIPIEEDQLFPRDFIVNIPAPSNYIGPDKVFGIKPAEEEESFDTTLPIINHIDDYQKLIPNGHKQDTEFPNELPESLKLAIKSFIITCSIRRLRGQGKSHNSMLIHVSRFINWQNRIKQLVENVFDFYRRGIEMKVPFIEEEMRQVFEVDTENYKSYKTVSRLILDSNLKETDGNIEIHNWDEVKQCLYDAVTKIEVREMNGGSADVLNYYENKNGLSVIVIGGNKLSRGLTLEGLSVSYYLRASRMYDTLMQMGRWFGYRPGYIDLCRLYTSKELNEWFCHITLASEELRREFDYLADIAGSTPEQFALKVRTHPGVLQISASNKIRRAENVDISWAGRLVESYQLKKNKIAIENNLKTTISLFNSLSDNFETNRDNYLWRNVESDLIKPFFGNFKVSDSLVRVLPSNLLQFINVQNNHGELTNWSIAFMSKVNTKSRYTLVKSNQTISIGFWLRTNANERGDDSTYFIRKNHIISPKDEFLDLSDHIYKQALKRTIEFHKNSNPNKDYKNDFPTGEIVRNEFRDPKNPLLLIYFLDPEGADLPIESNPLVGFAVSFPKSKFNIPVRYAIHKQLLQLYNIDDELENDNYDED